VIGCSGGETQNQISKITVSAVAVTPDKNAKDM
jgi:hypothetical protein